MDLFGNVGSDSSGDLYVQTILESDSTSVSWHSLSAGTVDTVYYADAAYNDSLIYIAYCAKDTSIGSSSYILAAAYNLNNSSFQNKKSLFDDPVLAKPAIAAEGDGNVYVALLEDRFHTDTMNVRLKKSTNSGVSWLGTVSVSNNSMDYPLGNVSIAATTDSIVWVGVDFNLGSDYNWGYYYSIDTAQTFTYSGVYSTNDHLSWDQHLGTMNISKSGSFVTVAFKEDTTGTHNVVFGWIQPSAPYHFYNDSLEVISDYAATNTFSPVACTKITHSGSYYLENSAVLYAGWGPTNVYFDGYNFTGVKEKVSNEKTTPNLPYHQHQFQEIMWI
ncbi:MAG: hypothetical protein GWP03_07065 [Proteobacteria bacterium]|nr:hypothetical protein [Pseudomonadota bacterium]